jgi:hypothetical protein
MSDVKDLRSAIIELFVSDDADNRIPWTSRDVMRQLHTIPKLVPFRETSKSEINRCLYLLADDDHLIRLNKFPTSAPLWVLRR